MRAPFQILAIPYKYQNDTLLYCILHRSDYDQWQFIAGGGEDKETPEDAAKREIREEGGISVDNIILLRDYLKNGTRAKFRTGRISVARFDNAVKIFVIEI